ncbi:lipoate-protein ligase B [Synechocystis sp. LKSZ1]
MPYRQAWAYQQALLHQKLTEPNQPDHFLLVEHPPVYTLGTGSKLEFLKFDPESTEYEVYRTERGGEVTYHCPGQLVGYPILDLRAYRQDLHWYLRQLEAVILQVVHSYGLPGERISGLTGVWVEGHKVAAIGIKVSRWITWHGFALNVRPDLAGFQKIVPCGIAHRPVGSLAQFLPDISPAEVQVRLLAAFVDIFGVTLDPPLAKSGDVPESASVGADD